MVEFGTSLEWTFVDGGPGAPVRGRRQARRARQLGCVQTGSTPRAESGCRSIRASGRRARRPRAIRRAWPSRPPQNRVRTRPCVYLRRSARGHVLPRGASSTSPRRWSRRRVAPASTRSAFASMLASHASRRGLRRRPRVARDVPRRGSPGGQVELFRRGRRGARAVPDLARSIPGMRGEQRWTCRLQALRATLRDAALGSRCGAARASRARALARRPPALRAGWPTAERRDGLRPATRRAPRRSWRSSRGRGGGSGPRAGAHRAPAGSSPSDRGRSLRRRALQPGARQLHDSGAIRHLADHARRPVALGEQRDRRVRVRRGRPRSRSRSPC